VFVLGPSQWERLRHPRTPRQVRDRIVASLSKAHDAYLMEAFEAAPTDRDLTDKFLRILSDRKTTHVLLYWPRRAKMQTTLDEILHLRHTFDHGIRPEVWLLAERGVLQQRRGGYDVVKGVVARSRYLDAINTLRANHLPWEDEDDLLRKVAALSDEFA
jgi:hypothetical protein